MATGGAKGSQTATQTVSITAMPTTSHATEASSQVVRKANSIEQLDEVLGNSAKVVMIEFFAEWCGPCKLIAEKLERWANIYDVTIVKVDVDELEDVAIEYNVAGIPAFVFLKERQVLEQVEGSHEDKIIAALEKHCKASDFNARPSIKPDTKRNVPTRPAAEELTHVTTKDTEKAEN